MMSVRMLLLGGVVGLLGCRAAPAPPSEHQSNKAVVLAFTEAANARDFDRVATLVTEDFVRHSQATPDLDIRNREQFIAFLEADAATFPDSRVEVEHLIAEGDKVAVWASYTGSQQGPMGPFPATGKRMSVDFGAVFRLVDGRIAELWVTWDNLAGLMQLGHIQPPKPSSP